MNPFVYMTPDDAYDAVAALDDATRPVAGGTNLIDLMKVNVMRPASLVDINALAFNGVTETEKGGLLLGALARNADTAYHPLVRERYPMLSAAILAGASPQIRNMASNGGNLLQRTRCYYFYDVAVPCNKREPGSGCPARAGLARQLAILGTSEHCIATHPSDMCVALAALDAVVHVRSVRGPRAIPFAEFHRLPGDSPQRDTTLEADELITHIELPPDEAAGRSTYLKVRERASYAFALVSVAAAITLDEAGCIVQARVALGGVAHRPWRDRQAEAQIQGEQASEPAFTRLANRLLQEARSFGAPPDDNAFKIPLARRAIVCALEMARDGVLTNTGELAAQNGVAR